MNRLNRRRRWLSIALEPLEGRRVLSEVGGVVDPLKGALSTGLTYVDLQGLAQGTPTRIVGSPVVGTTVTFQGAGAIQGVGLAKLKGSLHGTGFLASSRVQGAITLTEAKGSLTVQLEGSKPGGFTAPGSGTYSYSVIKGTGAFQHEFGSGTIRLTLDSKTFAMTFLGKPNVA